MGRPSKRAERRQQILQAFARVLAQHGYAGATINAVASEAGVAAGLLHHHFADKREMLTSLFRQLKQDFHTSVADRDSGDPMTDYVDAALALNERADVVNARCWVGLFAEALRDPTLFREMRRFVDLEIATIQRRSNFTTKDASATLAFIIGALVFGSFAPQKTAGFAADSLHRIADMFAADQ